MGAEMKNTATAAFGNDLRGMSDNDYRWPRALASASTRSTSRRRSESFLATHASQDFPVAVSSPVKAIAATSEKGIVMVPLLVAGKSSMVG